MMKRFLSIIACFVALQSFGAVVPASVDCEVTGLYGYRNDGTPGRIVRLTVRGSELRGNMRIDAKFRNIKESTRVALDADTVATFELMLPADAVSKKTETLRLTLIGGAKPVKAEVAVPPMRHWTVYLYNHSHVDVGYTNTHKNVELLHSNNLIEGMRIGHETAGLTDGARFVWNPEVTWPIERVWTNSPELRDSIVDAIKRGIIGVDAAYVNLNTSICSDEEMFHIFKFSRQLQRETGVPIDVFQQFDIPGISWGLVPVMARQGVKYLISWPNTDRGGLCHSGGIDGMPFWWVGPDGESKVLFLQPGKYSNSGSMDKGWETGRPWFGQRNPNKIPRRIEMGRANVDFTAQLAERERDHYPIDFIVLSWTLWDNSPVDADVPYAVDEWNRRYAYPKIVIADGHDVMTRLENEYGDILPTVTGDYTEYWTDGLGSAAEMTAINRRNKERITTAETLWSLLSDGAPAPRADFDEAWRMIMMGSEHTWEFENPSEPYFEDAILRVKKAYFKEAEELSRRAYEESLGLVADKSNGALGPREGPSNGGITVINTQSWPRAGIVTLSHAESLKGSRVVADDGKPVLSQRLADGRLIFLADTIAPFGSAHYRVVDGAAYTDGSQLTVNGLTASNGAVEVALDASTGNVASLRISGHDFNFADSKEQLNSVCQLPANVDNPEYGHAVSIELTENGPLMAEYTVVSDLKGCNSVVRKVQIFSGMPWVSMANVVDKQPVEEKESINFGYGFNLTDARTVVDIPWGVMEVEKDQWPQANRNWLTLNRWLDVSGNEGGVTWCSLDTPLFEKGKRSANIALGWGGQGPWDEKIDPSPVIYSWAMNNHWHTNFPQKQEGAVEFRYCLMPHDGYDAVASNRFGIEMAQPLAHITTDSIAEVAPVVQVDNPAVYVTIIKSTDKPGEKIVRLRSVSDQSETVDIALCSPYTSAWVCEVEEKPLRSLPSALTLPPYGMATILVAQ